MSKVFPVQLLEYYNSEWHPIRKQWIVGLISDAVNFGNTINNFMGSLNKIFRLLSVTGDDTTMDLINSFFNLIKTRRKDLYEQAMLISNQNPVSRLVENSVEDLYSSSLTPYAFDLVLKQFDSILNVSCNEMEGVGDDSFNINTPQGIFTASRTRCKCIFFKSMQLPCRHMFLVREHLELPYISLQICAHWWTRSYLMSKHPASLHFNATSPGLLRELQQIGETATTTDSATDCKYSRVAEITERLARLASVKSDIQFERRLNLLKAIKRCWETGVEITLQKAVADDNDTSQMDLINETKLGNNILSTDPESSLGNATRVKLEPAKFTESESGVDGKNQRESHNNMVIVDIKLELDNTTGKGHTIVESELNKSIDNSMNYQTKLENIKRLRVAKERSTKGHTKAVNTLSLKRGIKRKR